MAKWLRFNYRGTPAIGLLDDSSEVHIHAGDLFHHPSPTGDRVHLDQVDWLAPVIPRQFIGLWNNFHERRAVENLPEPPFPLYFVKLAASLAAHGTPIHRPPGFRGRVKFEAELGIVIGRECFRPDETEAARAIFGYTCVNDVTAPEPLTETASFTQWCRAKSFPGFGPIGSVIETEVDPMALRVEAWLDGEKRQDYPVSDMIFTPVEIVRRIASEVPLLPGDVIACGTSTGATDMLPGQEIEVRIPGVGHLINRFAG